MRLGESEGCCPEDEVRRVYEWLEAALAQWPGRRVPARTPGSGP